MLIGNRKAGQIMNQRKAIEAALAEMGITNETQLNDADPKYEAA